MEPSTDTGTCVLAWGGLDGEDHVCTQRGRHTLHVCAEHFGCWPLATPGHPRV